MGKIIDALIGRIETAEHLDSPGYALGKAISPRFRRSFQDLKLRAMATV